jgi:hypothetical protein
MLSDARVVPTVAVSDMERARHFYEGGSVAYRRRWRAVGR